MKIDQKTLTLIDRLSTNVTTMQRRLDTAKQRYHRRARPVITALITGAGVDAGARLAAVKTHRRRVIAWRREYEAKLGREDVQRIVDQTEPKTRLELVITRRV